MTTHLPGAFHLSFSPFRIYGYEADARMTEKKKIYILMYMRMYIPYVERRRHREIIFADVTLLTGDCTIN